MIRHKMQKVENSVAIPSMHEIPHRMEIAEVLSAAAETESAFCSNPSTNEQTQNQQYKLAATKHRERTRKPFAGACCLPVQAPS